MRLISATILLVAASLVPARAEDFPSLPAAATAHPALWPKAHSIGLVDPQTESFITAVMAKMSLREKVGQMIQADISSIRPEDLRQYPLGSILAGGNSPPLDADDRAPVSAWIRSTELFREVALEDRPGHVPIPLIFGMDSVHGSSNLRGAVIFPHNIGLGAMRDPALIREIGAATAAESASAGFDWAFAPTVAVPQDDRWGRTYEGYSEKPDITREYAAAMVEGLQGAPGEGRVQVGKVAATLKHFIADGGTLGGIDQGDARISERTLIDMHAPGFVSGIEAGAMTVMASFSSWNGVKNHANRSLLTDVLKGRLGFAGFVVGDWNAFGQIPGCDPAHCPVTFNAGLDMAMAPHSWKAMFDNTVKDVESGAIPISRVDDAVRRILRVKAKLGLFDPDRPLTREAELGGAEHRAIARRAVAESLVLLKNNNRVLPIKPRQRVLVTGSHADDIALQSGGWTLSWQGSGNRNSDFPNGTTIWAGLHAAIDKAGGTAVLSPDGRITGAKPDVAIVVFGERPYAEIAGDISTLEFQPGDKRALAELKSLKAAGIPTVSVFLSGRPLWVNPELNQSDAFVAAFLPGSEGEGIADVLVAKPDGKPNRDFRGRLSFSWPKTARQFTLNAGQPGYDPLFAYGYGLTYGDHVSVPMLDETPAPAAPQNIAQYYVPGKVMAPWSLTAGGAVATRDVDSADRQEAARQYAFAGPGEVSVDGPDVDLSPNAGTLSLRVDYRLDAVPAGKVTIAMGKAGALGKRGEIDATRLFSTATLGAWTHIKVPLRCFQAAGADLRQVSQPFALHTAGALTVSIVGIRLDDDPTGATCPGPARAADQPGD
jgi:beta-glucosidase